MATLIEKSQKLKTRAFIKADFEKGGVSRAKLARLVEKGSLERIERGIYRRTDAAVTEFESLATASLIAPKAVVCLLSALQFHDLTTQNPFEVWLAIERDSHIPKVETVQTRIFRFAPSVYHIGIENHIVEGVTIKVYSAAKTVADCFYYQKTVGLDVAIEALQDAWRKRKATMDEIYHFAKIRRVDKTMMPYLNTLN